jgi:hypothetical protein
MIMREKEGKSPVDRREIDKLEIDYLKHITTLSTGSILLIATFLQKFNAPLWRWALIISILGFMASVLASVIDYTVIVEVDVHKKYSEQPLVIILIGIVARLITWVGFLVGILSLAVFAIKNLPS